MVDSGQQVFEHACMTILLVNSAPGAWWEIIFMTEHFISLFFSERGKNLWNALCSGSLYLALLVSSF